MPPAHHWMVLQMPETRVPLAVPLLVPSIRPPALRQQVGVQVTWQTPPRRVSATTEPSDQRKLCLPAWVNVSMPLSINFETLWVGRFT